MNLLVVSTDFPYPATNGHRLRNWNMLRSLAAEGVRTWLFAVIPAEAPSEAELERVQEICSGVTLFPFSVSKASGPGSHMGALRALCSALPYSVRRFRSRAFERALSALVARRRFDAIFCETCYPFINLPACLRIPVIVDNHNLEHLLVRRYASRELNPLKRVYAAVEWRKLQKWERSCWQRSEAAVFCSETDRRVSGNFRANCSVVPNIVDLDGYRPNPAGKGNTVVYVGGMDWLPNRDAVRFFSAEVLPELRKNVPQVRFVVAGRGPDLEFRKQMEALGVVFTGTVPDMRPVMESADLCVVPLRIGSGTRLKILEAAAMGKAIVSTRIGAEGLAFTDGRDIRLADTPAELVAAVSGLLDDPTARCTLGSAARARVESDYSFPAMQSALAAVLAPFRPFPPHVPPKEMPCHSSTC